MVPTKSKMPMAASRLAACTCGMPKSRHIGIKCTWTRPLVEAPQMKKVANRIQKTLDFEASAEGPAPRRHDRRGVRRRRRQRLGAFVAEWPQAHIARPVAHDHQH